MLCLLGLSPGHYSLCLGHFLLFYRVLRFYHRRVPSTGYIPDHKVTDWPPHTHGLNLSRVERSVYLNPCYGELAYSAINEYTSVYITSHLLRLDQAVTYSGTTAPSISKHLDLGIANKPCANWHAVIKRQLTVLIAGTTDHWD